MKKALPDIWVLLGARAGDNAQALELARQLGGQVTEVPLRFNRLSGLPNSLLRSGFKSLSGESRKRLQPPWPDIVIAVGRRTAPVSLAIRQASGGRTLSIHIGRPRLPLSRFDLVLTTAQYGLPADGNVVTLRFPFATAKVVPDATLAAFRALWSPLPRPWIMAVIGAAKFPVQFGSVDEQEFARRADALARRTGGSLILMDSPRSAPGAIARVAGEVSVPHWLWQRGTGDNPYQAALQLADQLAVTSDSMSMVAEMVQTGKPTHVHHLPVSGLAPSWQAHSGFTAALARRGVLSPPRNVAAALRDLSERGWIADLGKDVDPRQAFVPDGSHEAAVQRILSLWRGRAAD